MNPKIIAIEITFAVPVSLPPGFEHALEALLSMICKRHEAMHPDRVMWVHGSGAKICMREPQEAEVDPTIYAIDVAERDAYPKEVARQAQEVGEERAEWLGALAKGVSS